MIKKINQNKFGVVEYYVSDESEIENLPKDGLSPTSTAMVVNGGGFKTFMFVQREEGTDGEWIVAPTNSSNGSSSGCLLSNAPIIMGESDNFLNAVYEFSFKENIDLEGNSSTNINDYSIAILNGRVYIEDEFVGGYKTIEFIWSFAVCVATGSTLIIYANNTIYVFYLDDKWHLEVFDGSEAKLYDLHNNSVD